MELPARRGMAGWGSAFAGGVRSVGVAFERAWSSRIGTAQVNSTGPAHLVKGRGLTRDMDLIRGRSPDFQLQAPSALRVVHAAKRWHTAHTAPVHVHLAASGDKTGVSASGPAPNPRLHPPAFPQT